MTLCGSWSLCVLLCLTGVAGGSLEPHCDASGNNKDAYCGDTPGMCTVATGLEGCANVDNKEGCLERDTNPNGSFEENSLNYTVNYETLDSFTISSHWMYSRRSDGQLRVPQYLWYCLRYCENESDGSVCEMYNRQRCICLHGNVSTVHFPLSIPYKCISRSLEIMISLKKGANSKDWIQLPNGSPIPDCWNVSTGNESIQTCGKQIPSQPVNLTVTAVILSSGTATVTVQWEPPLYHNTPIEKYLVALLFVNHTIENKLDGTVTQYKSNIKGLIALSKFTVEVQAGVSTSLCSLLYRTSGDITFGPVGKVQGIVKILPESSPEPYSIPIHALAWPIAAIFVALLVICTILIGVRRTQKRAVYPQYVSCEANEDMFSPVSSLITPTENLVFIVASTEESEGNKEVIRELCHRLGGSGIGTRYYEYEWTSQDPDSPAGLGINRWVSHQFTHCRFVLFVCTETFVKEWYNGAGVKNPLVWSVRHHLDGVLPKLMDISSFGVVNIGSECAIPIVLQRMQKFHISTQTDHCSTEELERYLLQAPPYNPPYVPAKPELT